MTNRTKLIFGIAVAAFAFLLTFIVADNNLYKLSIAGTFAIAMLGLNLLTGFNGQISLGHGAFMAIGGYTTAIGVDRWGMSYPVTFILAFVLCAVFGALIGIPALRLPGISLALITLALALAFPQVLKKFSSWTGGVQGLVTPSARQFNAPDWTGLTNDQFRYVVVVLVGALMFWIGFNLARGRWGLAMMSIRDNTISAASMGVNPAVTKVTTFAISAGFAGVGGALQAMVVGFMSPESVTFLVSIQLLTGIVIGGLATTSGAVLGGLFVVFMPNIASQVSDSPGLPGVIYGIIILIVMLLAPGGVIGLIRDGWRRLKSTNGHRIAEAPAAS